MNALLFVLAAATIPLRNPFWPVAYHGEREAIVDQPRARALPEPAAGGDEDTRTSVTAEAIAAAAAADDGEQVLERRWIKARKALRIGNTMRVDGADTRQSITINGRIYADGDLVSVTHDAWRFTWRVKEVTDNKTLRLVRVRARELEEDQKGTRP